MLVRQEHPTGASPDACNPALVATPVETNTQIIPVVLRRRRDTTDRYFGNGGGKFKVHAQLLNGLGACFTTRRVARFLEAYTDASSASPRGVLPPFRPFATSIADSSAVSWAS